MDISSSEAQRTYDMTVGCKRARQFQDSELVSNDVALLKSWLARGGAGQALASRLLVCNLWAIHELKTLFHGLATPIITSGDGYNLARTWRCVSLRTLRQLKLAACHWLRKVLPHLVISRTSHPTMHSNHSSRIDSHRYLHSRRPIRSPSSPRQIPPCAAPTLSSGSP